MPPKRSSPRLGIKHVAVGHEVMDVDHQTIVTCCNQIAASAPSGLEFSLHRLRSLLASHFRNEERLLNAAGTRLCSCHVRDHSRLLDLSSNAIRINVRDRIASKRLIMRDLIPLLRQHIAFRDQLIALHLNSIGAAPDG